MPLAKFSTVGLIAALATMGAVQTSEEEVRMLKFFWKFMMRTISLIV